ncbi:MAG: hypothetical protein CM1200mP40_12050 [Gammaproteobacteria bacterium]|nr:MAG: hypothetical protein CM1200mP40_12050 [Gammaproteobacteria bacterium]
MVTIRLSRGGAKKKPFYHITVSDSRKPRDGRFIERIGFFNPMARGQEERLRLDLERMAYWQNQGAQVSPRVSNLAKDAAAATTENLTVPSKTATFNERGDRNNAGGAGSDWQGSRIKGWLKLNSFTTPPENILDYSQFFAEIEEAWQMLEIDQHKQQANSLIVHFRGYDDPEVQRS